MTTDIKYENNIRIYIYSYTYTDFNTVFVIEVTEQEINSKKKIYILFVTYQY